MAEFAKTVTKVKSKLQLCIKGTLRHYAQQVCIARWLYVGLLKFDGSGVTKAVASHFKLFRHNLAKMYHYHHQ